MIQQAAPGIFTPLRNQDGTANDGRHPAAAGSTLQVFLTGLGPTDAAVPSGVSTPSTQPVQATLAVAATIGSQAADVLFAGLVPGLVGVYQVKLRVPLEATGAYPLIVQAGGVASNTAIVNIIAKKSSPAERRSSSATAPRR